MEAKNNYYLQTLQAKQRFLSYDQSALIRKLDLTADENYLYVNFLCKPHRIDRTTGDLFRSTQQTWQPADTHSEVMTLLDLVCDSREDRFLTGRWKQMSSFGLLFHRELLEGRDATADGFSRNLPSLHRACQRLGGIPMPTGDVSYAIELFDGLRSWLQFWQGDDEFPHQIRYLWDENALMYLKYETMYFAVNLLLRRLREEM